MSKNAAAKPTHEAAMAALALRVQATKLLEQASKIDGETPFLVLHNHRHGADSAIMWNVGEPSEEEAADSCSMDFEPEHTESIEVISLDITDMTGDYSRILGTVAPEEDPSEDSPALR